MNGSAAGAASRAVSEVLVYVGKDERLVPSGLPPTRRDCFRKKRGSVPRTDLDSGCKMLLGPVE